MEIRKGLSRPLRGERIIGIDPVMKPVSDPTWHRRLKLFTGRAISEAALNMELAGRNGRMAALGQMVSAGVVSGLEVTLDKTANAFHIASGLGMSPGGEDVVVPYLTSVPADQVRVMATAALLAGLPQDDDSTVETSTGPLRARVLGTTLAKVREAGIVLPAAGILLLQPTTTEVIGRPPQGGTDSTSLDFSTSSCELDDDAYAFEDWQVADGCRLILYMWPAEWLPLPAPGTRFRNRLAYAIFRREEELAASEFMPWELVGVPIGLVGLTDGVPEFVDRHSVVRAGGKPKRHATVFGRGNPFLWQARLEQFSEQLADEDAKADLDTIQKIAAEFRYLPPAGLLPKEAFNLTKKESLFFHDSYATHAVPVPIEQLDIILEASASLAPFDSFTADQARVLVPVPQAFYDPYLLIEAQPDPQFQKEITEAETAKEDKLQRRSELRKKATTIIKSMHGSPTPVEFTDKEEPKTPATAPREDPYDTHVKDAAAGTLEADEITKLVALFSGRTRELYTAELLLEGVEGFIENLDLRIRKADDAVDTGFLRAQTDIYRLRQLVLDATDASRLATSPALATIAKGESAAATRDDVSRFIKDNKTRTVGTGGASNAGTASGGFTLLNAPLTLAFMPVTLTLLDKAAAEKEAKAKAEVAKKTAPSVFYKKIESPGKVYDAAPLTGDRPDYKTITTAERLRDPKSEEARNYALATRAETVRNLSELEMDLDDAEIAGVPPEAPNLKTTFGNSRARLGDILSKIQKNEYDPLGDKLDEASLFQNGVRHIDLAVATLRSAEGQIKRNRQLLVACRSALENMRLSSARIDLRMKEVDDDLAEVRHDLSVGLALLHEEIARVKAINERRTAVLKEHVRFVAYHRPRFASNVRKAPSHYINPGVAPGFFPACGEDHENAPQEIREMVDLFRDAPASWFKELHDSIDKLHRLEMMEEAIRRARERASKPVVTKTTTFTVQAQTKLGLAINTSYHSQQQVMVSVKEERVTSLREAKTYGNWIEARDHARKVLSVEDLMDSGHGRSDAARDAIGEMNNIFRMAACLHDRLDNVLPIIRLEWAERLSQFDAVVPLRVLASLPRWDDIEYLDRLEMQMFVDWLFGRIDDRIPEAHSLINTLVRICILLASHSPVNQIIAGVVLQPAPLRLNGLILINVDHTRIFRGMAVQFRDAAGVMAQAVVDDLSPGKASARITKTYKEEIVLTAGSPVEFVSSKYTAQVMK